MVIWVENKSHLKLDLAQYLSRGILLTIKVVLVISEATPVALNSAKAASLPARVTAKFVAVRAAAEFTFANIITVDNVFNSAFYSPEKMEFTAGIGFELLNHRQTISQVLQMNS